MSRSDNAIKLARTMTEQDIEAATLSLPCNFCGAKPRKACRSTKNPERTAPTHSARGALLWAMWHKGYRAGRDRALTERSNDEARAS